jgi:hypothetical protein
VRLEGGRKKSPSIRTGCEPIGAAGGELSPYPRMRVSPRPA